jgi:hypothetical protein
VNTKPKRIALPGEWPVLLLALPAFVAIWGGWVGLGELTGFGPVNLLPGIGGGWTLNTAITLPIGVEAYAAYALRVWLNKGAARSDVARRFAMWSAIGSLLLGAAGQVAYHLMTAQGIKVAPWQITTFVSCLPVIVLGCGAALAHLSHAAPGTSVEKPPADITHTDSARHPQIPPQTGAEPHAVSPATPQNAAGETAPEPPARPTHNPIRPVTRPATRKPTRPRVTAARNVPPADGISDTDARARLRAEISAGNKPTVGWARANLGVGDGRARRLLAEATRTDLHAVKNEEVAVG